jgi:hypothetical protein
MPRFISERYTLKAHPACASENIFESNEVFGFNGISGLWKWYYTQYSGNIRDNHPNWKLLELHKIQI